MREDFKFPLGVSCWWLCMIVCLCLPLWWAGDVSRVSPPLWQWPLKTETTSTSTLHQQVGIDKGWTDIKVKTFVYTPSCKFKTRTKWKASACICMAFSDQLWPIAAFCSYVGFFWSKKDPTVLWQLWQLLGSF